MYTDGQRIRGIRKLPLNLLDALRATQKSPILRQALGDELIDSYAKLKQRQWDESYSAAISPGSASRPSTAESRAMPTTGRFQDYGVPARLAEVSRCRPRLAAAVRQSQPSRAGY